MAKKKMTAKQMKYFGKGHGKSGKGAKKASKSKSGKQMAY